MQKIQAMTLTALAIAGLAALIFAAGNPLQVFSQETTPLSGASTIKVAGEASKVLQPDQAVIILSSQIPHNSIASLIEEQDEKIQGAIEAIMAATDDNSTTVHLGQVNLNSDYYGGPGPSTYSNLTFGIYSSVSVPVSIDRLSEVINRLSQAGFQFETLSWEGSSAFIRELQYGPGTSGNNYTIMDDPVILSVSIATEVSTLEKAIQEHNAKYEKLLEITEEEGIPRDSIEPDRVSIEPSFGRSSQSYSMYSQLVVKTSVANAEKVAAAARQAALQVDSVALSASDSAIDGARRELNQQAIDDARSRANEIAQPLGLEAKGIRSIDATTAAAAPNQHGNDIVYRGVGVLSPSLYQNLSGEVSVAVTVEFELGRP